MRARLAVLAIAFLAIAAAIAAGVIVQALIWIPPPPTPQYTTTTYFVYGIANRIPYGGALLLTNFALPTSYAPVTGQLSGYVELNGTIYQASGTYYIAVGPTGYILSLSGVASAVGSASTTLGGAAQSCTFHITAYLSGTTQELFGTMIGFAYCNGQQVPISGYIGLVQPTTSGLTLRTPIPVWH